MNILSLEYLLKKFSKNMISKYDKIFKIFGTLSNYNTIEICQN